MYVALYYIHTSATDVLVSPKCTKHLGLQDFNIFQFFDGAVAGISKKMVIRSLLRVQAPKIAGKRAFCIPQRPLKTTRRYSTSTAGMAPQVPQSQAAMLATITSDLDRIAPRFEMQPEQIEIIQTPTEFYQTLKVGGTSFLQIVSFLKYLLFDLDPQQSFITCLWFFPFV
jgi:hypothetical protein